MEKLLFLGDSITDAHRLWMPEYEGYGNGYVYRICKTIQQEGLDIQVTNRGHDGFTVPWLLRTLDHDCLRRRPDAVSILIGINDVGVAQNGNVSFQEQDFAANYDLLLKRLLKSGISKLYLSGPFLFPQPLFYQNWMEDVALVEQIQQMAARRYHLPYLPLHQRMNQFAQEYGMDAVTLDGIHLTDLGHQLLADLWMDFYLSKSQ